jgi:uncharacterized small protein (DUF1192 family)
MSGLILMKQRRKTMATVKKPAAKKITPKAEEFRMPMEVKNWIDQASSRMAHMTSEIARLKEENKQLKRTHKQMEQRVMGMSSE